MFVVIGYIISAALPWALVVLDLVVAVQVVLVRQVVYSVVLPGLAVLQDLLQVEVLVVAEVVNPEEVVVIEVEKAFLAARKGHL